MCSSEKMSTPQEQLLGILQNLESKNFKTFKWYLQRRGALGDFSAIPVYCLENASREDTVDRMVQTYCEDAIKVANLILEKMKKKMPSVSKGRFLHMLCHFMYIYLCYFHIMYL